MRPSLPKLGMAVRLLLAGDFLELFRRIRVAILGNRPIAFPDIPDFYFGPTSGFNPVDRASPSHAPSAAEHGKAARCLVFAHNLNYEGAPVSQFELTRALAERELIAPEVVAFGDGPLRADYERAGIPVTVLPSYLDRIPSLSRLQLAVDELASLITARRVQVVYANTLLNFAPVIAARLAGIPSIWNIRESEPWETCFGFLNTAVAGRALAAIALPYRVVFVADATRRIWSPFDVRDNFTVIRNGLDLRNLCAKSPSQDRQVLRERLGYKDGDIVFLSVGTMCERKAQRDLVQAFGRLEGDLAMSSRLCMVGGDDPRYKRLLRSDIARLPSTRRADVALHGATSDVHSFYAAADVFVLASRLESYPRVVLEAMSQGLPVLATPVFGVLEQLPDQRDALFFEPGDVGTLACHMRRMATDRNLRAELAQRSRARFETLNDFDKMVAAYGSVFVGAYRSGQDGHAMRSGSARGPTSATRSS